jgi:hypothetical protein
MAVAVDVKQQQPKPGEAGPTQDPCALLEEFRRPNYFFGQLLSAREFQGEQTYVRRKLQLHNRCFHGYGIVCGLEVKPVPRPEDCPPWYDDEIAKLQRELWQIRPATDEEKARAEELYKRIEELKKRRDADTPNDPTLVEVQCGIALDCQGNEIMLTRPRRVDLWHALSAEDQKKYRDALESKKEILPFYLSICYCEQLIEPQRPVVAQECGPARECAYGWTRESVRFLVTLEAPEEDLRCEACCAGCCADHSTPCGSGDSDGCCCLLLAQIDGFTLGSTTASMTIDQSGRRPLTTYVTTRVKGVSWEHAALYSREDAETILGNDLADKSGFVVEFTRPVLAETITDGVIDIWAIEGPKGAAGDVKHIEGTLVDKPKSGPITRVKYRRTADDSPDPGDRVLIQVRSSFILDACCRAVDGENLGGRVPLLKEFGERTKWNKAERPNPVCTYPPPGVPVPWKSGNGSEGGDFISWFFVDHQKGKKS